MSLLLLLFLHDLIQHSNSPLPSPAAKRRRSERNFPGASFVCDQLSGCAPVKRKRVGVVSKEGPPARAGAKIRDRVRLKKTLFTSV